MTQEEFVAQLDENDVETLEDCGREGGSSPGDVNSDVLELIPLYLHYGLLVTFELEDWVYLVLTDAGRAAVELFRKRGT